NVEPDILGQNSSQPSHNLFRFPSLSLKVDNVRLHENRAAITESRHASSTESPFGVFFDRHAETFRGALQKIAISRGALGIQLKVLDLTILKDDQFDILAPDIADDISIFVEAQRRFSVGDGFYQRYIRTERIFENIFGITGSSNSQDFQSGARLRHLVAQFL